MAEETGVGYQDGDKEVCDKRSGPGGDVVGTQGEVGVLFVSLDGLGG